MISAAQLVINSDSAVTAVDWVLYNLAPTPSNGTYLDWVRTISPLECPGLAQWGMGKQAVWVDSRYVQQESRNTSLQLGFLPTMHAGYFSVPTLLDVIYTDQPLSSVCAQHSTEAFANGRSRMSAFYLKDDAESAWIWTTYLADLHLTRIDRLTPSPRFGTLRLDESIRSRYTVTTSPYKFYMRDHKKAVRGFGAFFPFHNLSTLSGDEAGWLREGAAQDHGKPPLKVWSKATPLLFNGELPLYLSMDISQDPLVQVVADQDPVSYPSLFSNYGRGFTGAAASV